MIKFTNLFINQKQNSMKLLFLLLFIISNTFTYSQTAKSEFKSVNISKIPKPSAPANLVIDASQITFSDASGNKDQKLSANETATLNFQLKNSGKGNAYALVLEVEELRSVTGLKFEKRKNLGDLEAGKTLNVSISLQGSADLQNAKANFKLIVKEANGFDSDPYAVELTTEQFKNPKLSVSDYTFSNPDGEGRIKLGQAVHLQVLLQNTGQGQAKNIEIEFINPENVFPTDKTNYSVVALEPNETKKIDYEFLLNKRFSASEVPIEINVKESLGKYGLRQILKTSLDAELGKTLQKVEVEGKKSEEIQITEVSLVSDVDKNIPSANTQNEKCYALIFGNEDYSSYQSGLQTESNVEFARNDARIFKEYCEKTLGIPSGNIFYKFDATSGVMKQNIDKMNKLIKNSGGDIEVIFYYAGHGFPDEKTQEAFLIPVDVSGSDLNSAIRLNDLLNSLTEFPSKRVTLFLDACFSGGARNQPLLAARGIKMKPKELQLKGNTVVFSASSKEQVSLPYREKKHGMFTYYLLKKMQETKGQISLKELSDYLNKTVSFESVKLNNKEQNPDTRVADEIKEAWLKWELK